MLSLSPIWICRVWATKCSRNLGQHDVKLNFTIRNDHWPQLRSKMGCTLHLPLVSLTQKGVTKYVASVLISRSTGETKWTKKDIATDKAENHRSLKWKKWNGKRKIRKKNAFFHTFLYNLQENASWNHFHKLTFH